MSMDVLTNIAKQPQKQRGLFSSLIVVTVFALSTSYSFAGIEEEESSKAYLGDKLRDIQAGTRKSVEELQDNAIKYNLYNDGVVSENPARLIADIHLKLNNASSTDLCGSDAEKNFSCFAKNILQQYSDIKFSSITSGTKYADDRKDLPQIFLNNIVTPTPTSQFNKDTLTKAKLDDPDFQKAYVKALSSQALISVGQQPFIDIIAKRTPISGANGQSMMEVMEEGASSRFLNDKWKQQMLSGTDKQPAKPEAILIDVAQMMSYQIWLQYQQYLQMENIQALLGAMLIQNVKGGQSAQSLVEQGSSIKPPENSATPSEGSSP